MDNWTADRIEGDYVVMIRTSDEQRKDVLLSDIGRAAEGDVFAYEGGVWKFLPDVTESRRKKLAARTRKLFE